MDKSGTDARTHGHTDARTKRRLYAPPKFFGEHKKQQQKREDATRQRIKSQLRTGYCYLNGYLHSVGMKDSPLCTCGEPESVKHYIEDCEQYVETRETLKARLFYGTGSSEFSYKLFLEVKTKDELQECREIISTKRFKIHV